ncbi:hypothetical protein CK203_057070 [Vitis vinifera]|uniref:PGG domain-containing protein n=1 Tax=Vitis vinifera TaxID=29760 RepID=A0A438GNB6_VITVI|nr:hypothetical protein CK203_057070 [Vitis vinifera]
MATQPNPPEDVSDDFYAYYRFNPSRDTPSDARNTLLVVGTLIAAATFQAGINPPGGVWQDKTIVDGVPTHPGRPSWVLTAIYSMSGTYGFSIAAVEPPGAVKFWYIMIAFLLPYAVRLSQQIFKIYKKRGQL